MKKILFISLFILLAITTHMSILKAFTDNHIKKSLYAYVASTTAEGINAIKIDVKNLTVVRSGTLHYSGVPIMIDISHMSSGTYLFVSGENTEFPVYKVDTKTSKVIAVLKDDNWQGKHLKYRYGSPIVVSPKGDVLYWGRYKIRTDNMTVIEETAPFVKKFRGYGDSYLFADGSKVISFEPIMGGELKLIDLDAGKEVKRVWFDRDDVPQGTYLEYLNDSLRVLTDGKIQISPDGMHFYATNVQYHYFFSNTYIKVLEVTTGAIVDSIFFPEELVPAPSSFSGKELAQIDPIFEKFADREDEFPVVMGYGEISVSPDSKYIFWPVGTNIQNSQISYVIVINIKTKKVVKRIPVGDGGITNVVFGYE
jgi:hypothetical protein